MSSKYLTTTNSAGIPRRKFLKNLAGLGAAFTAASTGPYIHANIRPKLRVLGTHVTLQEPLRQRAEQELGIDIIYEPLGDAELLLKASTRPESFDIYEHWSNNLKIVWQADTIKPIDKNRIQYWDEINALTKTGRLTPEATIGSGDAPYKLLHIQKDNSLGEQTTDKISFLPYVHNVDAFGYKTTIIPEGEPYVTESWGWLLDEKYHGKVGLINAPTIGIFDLGLAAEANGLIQFKDIGEMSIAEIDQLFDILIQKQTNAHFKAFWSSVPQSIEQMASGRVAIASMFSPAVSALNGMGIPVTYAAPREGYRGWHGIMCLSSQIKPEAEEAAYKYMNWWLSGWPGAFIARQGYYISNPLRARAYMSAEEWDYWYEGEPARTDLAGTDGRVSVQAGNVRTGGSYIRRLSHVAVWNTVMVNYSYSLRRWYELLTI